MLPLTVRRQGTKVLIFNQQGHRESIELLEGLHTAVAQSNIKFDHVIFCPTVPSSESTNKGMFLIHLKVAIAKSLSDHVNLSTDATAIDGLTMQKAFATKWKQLDSSSPSTQVLASVEDAFEYVRGLNQNQATGSDVNEIQILITGSVHLIGRALGILEGGAEAL